MSEFGTSQLTVNLDAYSNNLRAVRELLPEPCLIMAVVKANAYGLGAVPVAWRAVQEGVAMLGVATVGEALELRDAGIDIPIVVLVQPRQEDLPRALRHKIRLTLSDIETAERLGDLARKAKSVEAIHCEIDTGMGREGFGVDDAVRSLLQVTRISNVDIEAVCTHFPSADIADDPYTENQLRQFRHLLKQLGREGIPYELVHACNSAAIVNYPDGAFEMVRPGLMTYGVWPTDTPPETSPLEPVASWTSQVVLIRDLPGGASISYARTYRAPSPMKAAIVPLGYADGYPFHASNKAEVLIGGKRCPVRGRVTMNQMVVDVSEVEGIAVGNLVTLIGSDGGERITVEELAAKSDTIPYEILTGIGSSVTRKYTGVREPSPVSM